MLSNVYSEMSVLDLIGPDENNEFNKSPEKSYRRNTEQNKAKTVYENISQKSSVDNKYEIVRCY